MKKNWKCRSSAAMGLFVVLVLLATSCNDVYFKQPVPRSGDGLRSFPADWTGVYQTDLQQSENDAPLERVLRLCLRFERLSEAHLLVSTEYRIAEKDMPALKEILAAQKATGKLLDYRLSESSLFLTVKGNDEQQPGQVEQQYVAMVKKGPWYIFPQSIAPYHLLDLKAGAWTSFELEPYTRLQSDLFPNADSVSAEQTKLVARYQKQAYYFNQQKNDEANWTLIQLTQPSRGKLTLKWSELAGAEARERWLKLLPTIAIAGEDSANKNKYVIDPTDAELERILAEKDLFTELHLQKIEEK